MQKIFFALIIFVICNNSLFAQNCQSIEAEITASSNSTYPSEPGWIDVCPGDTLFLSAVGIYSQNGQYYVQSDETSIFNWDFGDGNNATGKELSHVFENPGGYYLSLTVTDQQECSNEQPIIKNIRVSGIHDLEIENAYKEAVCTGDTVELNALFSKSALHVFPDTFMSQVGIPLPDGTGASHISPILVSGFEEGQTLASVDELVSICTNIEHSWLRDLEITLRCPNGDSIILHNHPGNFGPEVFLGEPIDSDGTFPVQGIGYDYCWTPDAENGTWINYCNNTEPGTLPSDNYSSFESLNSLIGCPLNGEWQMIFKDLWGIDNGFMFSWTLLLETAIFSTNKTDFFLTTVENSGWLDNPFTIDTSENKAVISPLDSSNLIFQIADNYGCVQKALEKITVSSLQTEVEISAFTANCDSTGSLAISSDLPTEEFDIHWSTGEDTTEIEGLQPGLYHVTILDGACENSWEKFVGLEDDCSVTTVLPITVCEGDTIEMDSIRIIEIAKSWEGINETYSIQYDSIIVLNIQRLPVFETHNYVSLEKDSLFNGTMISSDTTIVEVLTSINGCDSIVTNEISILTNTNDFSNDNYSLKISPNPAKDLLTLSYASQKPQIIDLAIFDASGIQIWKKREIFVKQKFVEDINLSVFPSGIYFIQFHHEDGVGTRKFVKN